MPRMPKMDTLNLKGHRKCGCVAKGWFPVLSDGVFVGFSIDPDESLLFNHNEGRLSEYGEIYFDPPRGRIFGVGLSQVLGSERGLPMCPDEIFMTSPIAKSNYPWKPIQSTSFQRPAWVIAAEWCWMTFPSTNSHWCKTHIIHVWNIYITYIA